MHTYPINSSQGFSKIIPSMHIIIEKAYPLSSTHKYVMAGRIPSRSSLWVQTRWQIQFWQDSDWDIPVLIIYFFELDPPFSKIWKIRFKKQVTCFIFCKRDYKFAVGTNEPWKSTGFHATNANILFLPCICSLIFPQSHKSTEWGKKVESYFYFVIPW